MAATIKHRVRKNKAAKSWFQETGNISLFVMFVVLTGGCYPALALVSSGIFGLDKFTSGMTQYELKKLSKLKVISTVMLSELS